MKDCKAPTHTNTSTNQLIKQAGDDYCHLPSPEEIEIRLFTSIVKERGSTKLISISQIFDKKLFDII
jgi:hypothetical protein